jgi:hypoxanthine phosphoribosyltransferase
LFNQPNSCVSNSPESASAPVVKIDDDVFELYISDAAIAARIAELGRRLEADYAGTTPVVIGILNGAVIFMADLIRAAQSLDMEIDFYRLSSYGDKKITSGDVKKLKDINTPLVGRDVIVVEDVIDSGLSVKYIRNEVLRLNPKSLRFCALLYKEGVAALDFEIDYIGFKIPKQFVIGYGLDIAEKKRNLKGIYRLKD